MSRALLRQPWCRACLHETVRSFRSASGVSTPRYTFPTTPVSNGRSPFSTVSRRPSEHPSSNNSLDNEGKLVDNELSARQPLPWYLQEETPVSESQPVSLQGNLPELPENPPMILPPLLEYTYKDLGLDNLNLVDLRSLETPAALGANVIMVIGTARSVKHLNVSADRLCRWMRSTWRLAPYADGLLGRNELKIKLRRKARRARAATQAGALLEEKDDGITTGWICVNAGVVQEDPSQPTLQDQGVEGFGNFGRGTRVVVQVFTEEKRAEVDLDGLWKKRLEQAERQAQRLSNHVSEAAPEKVREPAIDNLPFPDRDFGHVSRSSMNLPFEQRRGLHRLRPLAMSANEDQEPIQRDTSVLPDLVSNMQDSDDPDASKKSMSFLFKYLYELPDEQRHSVLGTGPDDDSTLFLRLFRLLESKVSPMEAALARVQILCAGITYQNAFYSKEALWQSFTDYVKCGYTLSEETGFYVVSALLAERPESAAIEGCTVTASDIEQAMRVCEQLSLQGTNVLTMRVFNLLYKAARHAQPASRPKNEALIRIPRVVEAFKIPFDPKESRVFMWSLFEDGNYDEFWRVWHCIPRRDVADYEQLFRSHVELGDWPRAKQCAETWLPMLRKEHREAQRTPTIVAYARECLGSEEEDELVKRQEKLSKMLFRYDKTSI